MKVLVGIPCLNEEANLRALLCETVVWQSQFDFLVIDDGSTDGTSRVAAEAGVTSVRHHFPLGSGGAVKTGISFAARHGYDAFVQMDGDGQHDPSQIQRLLPLIEAGQADLVIGSRFIGTDGASTEGFKSTMARRLGIGLFSRILTGITHTRITDVTSGFKAIGPRLLGVLADEYLPDFPDISPVMVAHFRGLKTVEVPVSMRERVHGQSEFTWSRCLRYPLLTSVGIASALLKQRTATRSGGA